MSATSSHHPGELIRSFVAHHMPHRRLHHDAERGHEIYQVSTINAILDGVYDGDVTYAELARHGDFGLGTFNHLDGEMVAVDGRFFHLRSDGSATPVAPEERTPFAAVTFFEADAAHAAGRPRCPAPRSRPSSTGWPRAATSSTRCAWTAASPAS